MEEEEISSQGANDSCNRMGTSKAPGPGGIPNITLNAVAAISDMFPDMYYAV